MWSVKCGVCRLRHLQEIQLRDTKSNIEMHVHFSRMRSKGFLFSFLGVWGWWTVCSSFCFFSNRVVGVSMGKARRGDVLWRVKAHFAWQAWDFVALKRKLLWGSLMSSSPLSMGKVRRGDVLWRVKVHFAWQAWDFVALRWKWFWGSLMASLPLSFGEVRKGDVPRRVKLHCEV